MPKVLGGLLLSAKDIPDIGVLIPCAVPVGLSRPARRRSRWSASMFRALKESQMPNPRSPWWPLTRLIPAPRDPADHRDADRGSAPNLRLPAPVYAGVYVDVENLPNTTHAQRLVETVIAEWPDTHPSVTRLSLYVPAQKADLWRFWGRAKFPGLALRVRGVQRFTRLASKNAADMAIAVDAIHDFVTTDTGYVAVVSNDSDFAALFVKIQELADAAGRSAPFLWITVGDGAGLSQDIRQFVRDDMRWDVPLEPQRSTASGPPTSLPAERPAPSKPAAAAATAPSAPNPDHRVVADRLLTELPEGRFKAQHALKVIERAWPGHAAAANTQRCGQFLAKELWPLLQKRGVKLVRQNSPRTYEITTAAKAPRSG